jgi:hypothetical protein
MKSGFLAACIGLTVSVSALAASAAHQPLDAPEATYWHAGSQTWLVSSLGGGLSLARDGIGWLVRYVTH